MMSAQVTLETTTDGYIPWLNASNEQGTAAGNHAFSLGQQELSRSIAVMGNRHLAVFMRKLKSGQAVTVVVFGASVGQQGGCIEYDPRSPRCFAWSGSPPRAVNMAWGSPRSRSFKGYLVRWFEWLNSTWPNPQHRLLNFAHDAIPIEHELMCLSTSLYPEVRQADLVLL
jgi:hypothetical protein